MTKKDKTRRTTAEERNKVLDEYQLDAVDKTILDAMFDFPGITTEEIGKLVNLVRQSVSVRINREKFKRALAERTMAPRKKLEKAAPRILERYLRLCEFAEEGVSERACAKVLNTLGIIQQSSDIKVEGRLVTHDLIKRPGDRGETEIKTEIIPIEKE